MDGIVPAGDVSAGDSAVGSEHTDGADSSFRSCDSGPTKDSVGTGDSSNLVHAVKKSETTDPGLHACVSMISDAVHLQKAMTIGSVVDPSIVSLKYYLRACRIMRFSFFVLDLCFRCVTVCMMHVAPSSWILLRI